MRPEVISRAKKMRFLLSMSEDAFRDRVVRPLLFRLGYQDGRELCGPKEAGKDAIFAETDKLGFTIIVAVQTKKGPLNLAKKASQNVVDAITQLRTALETSVVLLKDRRKVVPNRGILIASGEINEQARNHIIAQVASPNIQFMDAHDLIPLIDKQLPELWLGIDVDIQPYFRAIESLVLGASTTRGALAGAEHDVLDPAATDDSFVDLSFHKMIVRRKVIHGTVHESPGIVELKLQSLLNDKSTRLLLLGDPGSGKSSCLLRLAYQLVRNSMAQDELIRIPVMLRAIDIFHAQPTELLQILDNTARTISGGKRACFTVDDLNGGNLVVFIDSLDELATDNDRRYVVNTVNSFAQRFPKVRILIASRPYRFTSEMVELGGYQKYNISPINWRQTEKIFNRVQKGKRIPASVTNEVMRKLEKMHGIELNPLLVTVLAAASDVSKQDIPANITELFKKFTELMLGRWDERKGLRHQYQAPLKDHVVMHLAFSLHQRKTKSLTRQQVYQIVNEQLQQLGHAPEGEQLLSEILERSGLFRVIGDSVEFRHHLLQEFFAGRAIPSAEYVNQVITDEWWTRALVFYFGENPSRVDVLKGVIAQLSSAEGIRLSQAAFAVGLAIQACYLSPVAEKLDVWKWVNRSLSISRDETLHTSDLFPRVPLTVFVTHYLYNREAVALANLAPNLNDLLAWCKDDASILDEHREAALFWLLTGLIESGDLEIANQNCRTFHPKDPRLLVALHLGCYLADSVRPLDAEQKAQAKEIWKRIDGKVSPYRKQISKEWGSLLLELRNGIVTSADDEVTENKSAAIENKFRAAS